MKSAPSRKRTAAILAAAVMAGSASFAAAAEITAWFAPGALKIKRDALPVPAAPLCGDLAAARNEAESCQLALRAEIFRPRRHRVRLRSHRPGRERAPSADPL